MTARRTQTTPAGISRRDLLRLGLLGTVTVAAASCGGGSSRVFAPPEGTVPAPRPVRPPVRWPGHQPEQVYLGVAPGGDLDGTLAVTGPVGARRTFYQWSSLSRELETAREDHDAGRLPWTSFKPPGGVPDGWSAVASGAHDEELRERARGYDDLDKPIIVTFHHEPHNEPGQGAEFAAAWMHTYDVMHDETGLRNVALVPILGEWVFNERNPEGDPADYLPHELLERCAFLGVDVYQNRSGETYAERLGAVLAWLDSRGFSRLMIGVGETGATDDFGAPTGADWWNESWGWVERNTDRVGAVVYFNSQRNNRSGNDWLLTQSEAKLEAFRTTLRSPRSCTLD